MLLVPSPLLGPATWRRVEVWLRKQGHEAQEVDLGPEPRTRDRLLDAIRLHKASLRRSHRGDAGGIFRGYGRSRIEVGVAQRGAYEAKGLIWHRRRVRAADTFTRLDFGVREDDSAERLVRRFFDACETPRRRARTDRVLRRIARSALGGTGRWNVMNALVSNRVSKMAGIDDRAKRMQLISAHLLGLAYARYVFEIEPLASLPVEQIIALSVPVVQHYMVDCPPVDRHAADPCVFAVDDRLPRRCTLCAPAYR